ncbi:DUF721 domain-containing protein [Sphingomonas daechungensis]|uniref:DUF721 domain-containing protein n=1 Tax=Sphingomonas daechungensis TaxID=1176646 RepID=UPI00295003E7|nr:DciA family protein [Sphingomonas daechungensis]
MGEIGGVAFRRFGFVQGAIVSRWSEIVGERYARVSSPESIRFPMGKKSGGVLTLLVEGAHSPLLQHLAPLIIERVNRFFGYGPSTGSSFGRGSHRHPGRSRRARSCARSQGIGRRTSANRRSGASRVP